tara:strand:- start:2322 stop:2807 length:486 start_codon:yes stop_codon:yes gene_type:complete
MKGIHVGSLAVLIMLTACSLPKVEDMRGKASTLITPVTEQVETLSVLSAVGGFSLVGGIVLIAVTRGSRGWLPVIIGGLLVLLNYMVAAYSHLIFYPLVVFTGLISGAWTYRIVRQILNERRTSCSRSHSVPGSSVVSSGSLSSAAPRSSQASSSRVRSSS